MAVSIRRVNYYYITIKDNPGEAYQILSNLSDLGVNLFALQAIPMGLETTQLALFPEDDFKFTHIAKESGMSIGGPHAAILVQGDDEIGVLAKIHERLYQANVNVYATNGVASGEGTFGYVIYVRSKDFDKAAESLQI